MSLDCIFCQIIAGESQAHIIWEDEKHMAFLSIFPNTDGFTVVTTKKHYSSYAFDREDKVLVDLLLASKKVAKRLNAAFSDVGRIGFVLEGYGVDHLHSKLIPMHGTPRGQWKKMSSKVDKFFEKYEGYLSSHDYKREDEEKLKRIALKIRVSKA